jgi:hypothetical protein
MISKNSIQINNYNDFIFSDDLVSLNHINVAQFNLFETPLKDKDYTKRVVLFSDNPLEEQIYKSQMLMMKIWYYLLHLI